MTMLPIKKQETIADGTHNFTITGTREWDKEEGVVLFINTKSESAGRTPALAFRLYDEQSVEILGDILATIIGEEFGAEIDVDDLAGVAFSATLATNDEGYQNWKGFKAI